MYMMHIKVIVKLQADIMPVRVYGIGGDSLFLIPCLGPFSTVEMILVQQLRCGDSRWICDDTWEIEAATRVGVLYIASLHVSPPWMRLLPFDPRAL